MATAAFERLILGTNLAGVNNGDGTITISGAASGILATLFDAKGDLIVASAADTAARLAVGSDGQALIASASAPNGVVWGSVGVGAGGALTMLADTTLGSDAASIDPGAFVTTSKHLLIAGYLRQARVATTDSVQMRLNTLSTAIYYDEVGAAVGATASASEDLAATSASVGRCPADSATALRFGALQIWIPHYTNTTNHKTWTSEASAPYSTTTGTIQRHYTGGVAALTAAVSQVTLISGNGTNFRAGSRLTVFGMG